ncbi:MAG: hypothetical protein V1740_07490 [Candidatus Woesearchaeota archaeon]
MDHEEQERKNTLFGAAYFFASYTAGDTQDLVVFYGSNEAEDFIDKYVRDEFRDHVIALDNGKLTLDDFVFAEDEGVFDDFFFFSRINIFSPDEFEYDSEDKYDLGEFDNEQECIDFIKLRIMDYYDDLTAQYQKRGENNFEGQETTDDYAAEQSHHQSFDRKSVQFSSQTSSPTYRDIHPENLGQYILDHFIDYMGSVIWQIDGIEAMSAIEEDLIIFSRGSPFIKVVYDMVHEFKHGLAFNNDDYLELFLREIEAVNLGSYRRAAGYRHQRTLFEAEKAFWID